MAYYPEILTADVTITSTQMLNLAVTPVAIVAGVAGYVISLRSYMMYYHAGATPYNPATHDCLGLFQGPIAALNSGCFVQEDNNTNCVGFIDQTVDMVRYPFPSMSFPFGIINGPGQLTTQIVGQPMSIFNWASNAFTLPGGANWTQGNGTLEILLRYTLLQG